MVTNLEPVQRRDYFYVALFTLSLYGVVLAVGGPLTMHEGVLSQTTKAMLANHDWLVPRYGDAPWLERPPLPQWISCVICAVLGHCDEEWNIRVGPALAGVLTVLLTVWLSGRLFGRATGILSGLILATMYNFIRYSTLAEADIFLAPIIAGTLCIFAYTEILRTRLDDESRNFFGKRPWCVLAFFVLLGMTNLVKGLVFGTVIVLAPVGIYLLWNFRWQSIARYCWLWGWLGFFAVALPWPLLAYQRYPDALDVWEFDLFGRLNSHYLEEPAWYYFACLTWVPMPWSIAAFVGLGLGFKKVWKEASPADRFVWCWAWMPLLVFSLSHGKHHHYMIHYLAPWAILAAQATVWNWRRAAASWLPCPPGVAVVVTFAVVFVLYSAGFAYKGTYLNRSREDTAFLYEVRRAIPLDQPLMINSADEALEGLRMQYYIGDTVYFLHNLSFVRDDRVHAADVYVVTRYSRMPELAKYGQVEEMLRCKQSRREQSEADRWTLFHLHLRADLPRKNADVRISPMQAMYREPGPVLD
jgi:4-amino-4-deoxy-L-arabinose transferase-like glycosyltransferase